MFQGIFKNHLLFNQLFVSGLQFILNEGKGLDHLRNSRFADTLKNLFIQAVEGIVVVVFPDAIATLHYNGVK